MNRLPMNLQIFADEPAGGGAEEFTPEKFTELQKNYKKLESEFTKVTQKNSEYSKDSEKVKQWLEFDNYLEEMQQKTGQELKPQVGRMIDSFISSIAEGKAPTAAQMGQLDKQIDKAEDEGNKKLAKELEYLKERAMQADVDTALASIQKEAEAEGIDYNQEEFIDFLDKWLDDLGIGDEDEFDTKHINKAYQAYEAQKLKEMNKKGNIPPLGTSGGTGSPDRQNQSKKVGGLKGAAAAALKYLS